MKTDRNSKAAGIAAALLAALVYLAGPLCTMAASPGALSSPAAISSQGALGPVITISPGAVALASPPAVGGQADYSQQPDISAEAAILIDSDTGAIIFEKNQNERLPMASLTKMMTTIIALESYKPNGAITITDKTKSPSDARFVLKKGEVYTVDTLIYAMLMVSSNESATAIASGGSSEEAFIARMNEKAKELGASNTHYVTPHGLTAPNHYSTAYDLALIARYAMQDKAFRKYVSTRTATVGATSQQGARVLVNSNRLFNDTKAMVTVYGKSRPVKFSGATGIKTGYTAEAGTCLAASASKDGLNLISIVLKDGTDTAYQDTISLFEYGLHNFSSSPVLVKGKAQGKVAVSGGSPKSVGAVIGKSVNATLPKNADPKDISIRTVADAGVAAPVAKGDVVGKAIAYYNGIEIGRAPLVAEASVGKSFFTANSFFSALTKVVLIAAAILLVIIIIALIRSSMLRHRGSFSRRSRNDYTSKQVKRVRRIK